MVITFDFDDTLLWKAVVRDEDGSYVEHNPIGQNPYIFPRLLEALDSGNKVHIVTSRRSRTRPEVLAWLEEWGVLDRLAGVHFTEGQLKHDTLERLGSRQHFDDDPEELAHLPEGCRGIRAPLHPSWSGQLGEGRYIESSRSDAMRRRRAVSREEALLRETVRQIMEVDKKIADIAKQQGIPDVMVDDQETAWKDIGSAFDIMGALSNLADHPLVTGLNYGSDVLSLVAAIELRSIERKRYDLAMNAYDMLVAQNNFYHDATGTWSYQPSDLDVFKRYYSIRRWLSIISLCLTIISIVGSVAAFRNPTGTGSKVEWAMKGAKLALAALQKLDAEDKIDIAQSVENIIESVSVACEAIERALFGSNYISEYGVPVTDQMSNVLRQPAVALLLKGTLAGDIAEDLLFLEDTTPLLRRA
jgi:hypothetical protein